MKILRRKPFARGVSQLMYVGDDDAVEKATGMPTKQAALVTGVAALVALKSKGIVRLAAGGIAAWVGYRLYKAESGHIG